MPYRLRGDGDAILVPADQALRLRMTLAEENLPRGGTVGDEIFDTGSALGTTDFLANVNLRRALEGELARTIGALADVRSARVHLVLPRHELFQRDQIQPSASITLRMQGGRRLNRRQVQAIQHLVAAAVPGLVPERITVVDDHGDAARARRRRCRGQRLPSQAEDFRERLRGASQADHRAAARALARAGPGAGRGQRRPRLRPGDDDRGDLRSRTARWSAAPRPSRKPRQSSARDDNTSVSVGNNLPNAAAKRRPRAAPATTTRSRTEETVNYEISHKVQQPDAGGRPGPAPVGRGSGRRQDDPERGRRPGLYAAATPTSWPRSKPGALGDRLRRQRAATSSRS